MKKIAFLSILLVLLYSCDCEKGTGKLKTQDYDLEKFTGIVLGSIGEVNLSYSETPSLTIETDENLFEILKVEVKKGKLIINTTKCISNYTEMNIDLRLPDFNFLEVSGAVELNCLDTFDLEKLEVEASGAGKIQLFLIVNNLETEISGAGDIELFGTANNHFIDISGAGSLSALGFSTNTTDVEVSGAGSSFISVNNNLKARVSGSGDIIYKGNPQKVDTDVSGVGKIRNKSSM